MNTPRILSALLFAVALITNTGGAMAQPTKQIQLTQLEAMFANIRAKTKWNVDGPLLWGYFFFDPSQGKLKQAATELEAAGYRVVSIEAVENKPLFRLHIEKVEVHNPTSLHLRNTEFYAFAEKHSLASYDGMDVGPVPASSK